MCKVYFSIGPSSRGSSLKKLLSPKFVQKKLISLSRQRWLHGIDIGPVVCGHPSQSVKPVLHFIDPCSFLNWLESWFDVGLPFQAVNLVNGMIVDGLGHVSLDSQPVQPVAAVNNIQPNIHQGKSNSRQIFCLKHLPVSFDDPA